MKLFVLDDDGVVIFEISNLEDDSGVIRLPASHEVRIDTLMMIKEALEVFRYSKHESR